MPAVGRQAPGWAQQQGMLQLTVSTPSRRKSKAHLAGSTCARPGLLARVNASAAEEPVGIAELGEALRHQTSVHSRGYMQSTAKMLGSRHLNAAQDV